MTFFLLLITSKLSKHPPRAVRLILASAVGGLYSMIILLDELPEYITAVSKLLASLIIVAIAFKFYRLRSYALACCIYYFSSFIMLGIIVGVYTMFKLDMIAVNNSTVYLDISAKGIVLAGFCAYMLSSIIVRLYNRTLSKKELYTIVIENNGERATAFAMLDTGNKLREPFSNSPVIVVSSKAFDDVDIVGDSKTRLIPASSVGSSAMLSAFKPDKIIIKSSKNSEVIDNAYIAISNDMNPSSFSAILNPDILSV